MTILTRGSLRRLCGRVLKQTEAAIGISGAVLSAVGQEPSCIRGVFGASSQGQLKGD